MIWVELLVLLVLVLSFYSGFKEGAVKNFFSLIISIISIPLTGLWYHLIATLFAFLPGENWENFIGFFITLGLINAILQLIIVIPRKIVQKMWKKGVFSRLIGGGLNLLNVSVGLVVFTLVIGAYPFVSWLEKVVTNLSILSWLVTQLGFVQLMLPEIFQETASLIVTVLVILG